ncbi:hypothetical protein SETIT_2G023900v2 [Setaria italica]|uniref:C2H2-type domain-containing protein n=1 Tax=Setaria italica TaxID=4555 RepID=A0A368PWN4_SETIT|nr:hypothetical protein SETIT_2G023900v2 [Setaria italica]
MASGSAEDDRWRRGGRRCHAELDDDELEEGEFDPAGCQSETDTEEYYNRHSPSESDETVSDCDRETSFGVVPGDDGGASTSSSVAQGWGGTGKRGCSGPAARAAVAVSPSAEPVQSTANVPAEPTVVLQPMPLANVSSMSTASARANLSGQSSSAPPAHDDAMEIAVAGAATAANPPTEAVIHHQPIAPQPPPAREQHVHQQPPVAPPAAGAAGRQDPNGYTCKKCGMWFRNHQGLGGHMVGHKNRELAAAAAPLPADGDAAPAGRRNPRPEKVHVCNECGAEFRTGVQLGGHKRKHWTGPPIVPKKKPRVLVVRPLPPPAEAVADLTLALSSVEADEAPPAPPAVEAARPAVERTPASRPPAAPGRTPEAPQQGSPATESSASTSGQQ